MKGKGEIDKELFNNEPAILAGNLEDSIYIEENTCASQPMVLTMVGLVGSLLS